MFDELLERLSKLVREQYEEPSRPRPETPTIPRTPTREPRKKPRTPISPTPGKQPRPKASADIDVELFKRARSKMTEMAFDPGKFPDFVDPSRREWIETGDPQLDKLLPRLSEGEQSYFEMITSRTYQDMIARLEKYTGLQAEDIQIPQLLSVTMQSVQRVKEIEADNKDVLEKMVLDVVLGFPEFKMVREAYENGELDFDIRLEASTVDFSPELEAGEDELSDAEKLNLELADGLEEINELDLDRRLANLLIQGNAVLKTYLFNIVNKELTEIDPTLPNLYGILAVVSQFGYWFMPPGFEEMANEGEFKNSEEVLPEDEGYVIRVRAFAFPYAIHELVKGIYEWISITEETGKSRGVDSLAKETEDMIVGPELSKILASYIPAKKEELLPLVHKKLLQLSRDDVKEVFAKSEKGRSIMRKLVLEAENEWSDYREDTRQSNIEAEGL